MSKGEILLDNANLVSSNEYKKNNKKNIEIFSIFLNVFDRSLNVL